jgi:hypothetical protein
MSGRSGRTARRGAGVVAAALRSELRHQVGLVGVGGETGEGVGGDGEGDGEVGVRGDGLEHRPELLGQASRGRRLRLARRGRWAVGVDGHQQGDLGGGCGLASGWEADDRRHQHHARVAGGVAEANPNGIHPGLVEPVSPRGVDGPGAIVELDREPGGAGAAGFLAWSDGDHREGGEGITVGFGTHRLPRWRAVVDVDGHLDGVVGALDAEQDGEGVGGPHRGRLVEEHQPRGGRGARWGTGPDRFGANVRRCQQEREGDHDPPEGSSPVVGHEGGSTRWATSTVRPRGSRTKPVAS